MTDNNHLITPPTELVQQIADGPGTWLEKIRKAYCAGADQELEASVVWLIGNQNPRWAAALQEGRRHKPPSLKEQAQRILVENGTTLDGRMELDPSDIAIIRRALESLPD